MTVPLSGEVDLQAKTAVVTGANGGIGTSICEALAREGADIVAADITTDDFDELVARVQSSGASCHTVTCDVTEPQSVETLLNESLEAFEGADILVCSHGISSDEGIEESIETWTRILEVNLTGTFLLNRQFFRHMQRAGGGKIVNIGSLAGKIGVVPAGPSYSVSKAAVHQLTRWFATVGAPKGIYVNAVAPGSIRTPLTDMGEAIEGDSTPLNRLGEPADVAEAVLFLASQQSNWVTGSVIDINGGVHMD